MKIVSTWLKLVYSRRTIDTIYTEKAINCRSCRDSNLQEKLYSCKVTVGEIWQLNNELLFVRRNDSEEKISHWYVLSSVFKTIPYPWMISFVRVERSSMLWPEVAETGILLRNLQSSSVSGSSVSNTFWSFWFFFNRASSNCEETDTLLLVNLGV